MTDEVQGNEGTTQETTQGTTQQQLGSADDTRGSARPVPPRSAQPHSAHILPPDSADGSVTIDSESTTDPSGLAAGDRTSDRRSPVLGPRSSQHRDVAAYLEERDKVVTRPRVASQGITVQTKAFFGCVVDDISVS